MVVGLHEVVNGEIVFPVVKTSTAPNDLLELNHGVYRAHEDDVPNVTGTHAQP